MKLNLKNLRLKKSLLLSAVALLCSTSGFAQFSFELGGTILVSGSKEITLGSIRTDNYQNNTKDTSYNAYTYSAYGIGLFAYPKFQVAEFANHGLSVGAPLTVGFASSVSSRTNASSFSFAYDLNATLDINGGNYNTNNDNAPFGYFLGIGYGISNSTGVGYEGSFITEPNDKSDVVFYDGDTEDVEEQMDAKTIAPLIHAGIGNFTIFENVPTLKSLGLRLAYRPSLSDSKLSYYMLSLALHF